MEEKLFWISIVSGAWALVLRGFLKKRERLAGRNLTAFMHGAWWALVGCMVGGLLSTYWERPDLALPMMFGLGFGGLVLGISWRYLKPNTAEAAAVVMADDLEWADTGFSSILLAAFIMYFFIQAFKIPSGSMEKTLLIGDHLFVNKLIYGVRVPYTEKRFFRVRDVKRGDIVVFRFPSEDKSSPHYGKDFIKRAIGLPGDIIQIKDKKVYVNGELQKEDYTTFADDYINPPLKDGLLQEPFQQFWEEGRVQGDYFRDNFGPIVVPPGHYFCMGDNRDRSYDSRFWGPMPLRYLKGKAWFVYWPLSRRKIIR